MTFASSNPPDPATQSGLDGAPMVARYSRLSGPLLRESRASYARAVIVTATSPHVPKQPLRKSQNMSGRGALDGDLRAHLDHPPGRDLEEVGGVARRSGKTDEEPVLPAGHARPRCRL